MRWKICRHCIAVTNHGDKWCIWYLCVCIFLPIGKNLVDLPPHCNTWWWRQVVTIIGICVFAIFENWREKKTCRSATTLFKCPLVTRGDSMVQQQRNVRAIFYHQDKRQFKPLCSYMHLNLSATVLKQIPLAARCATLVSIHITEVQKVCN